MAVTDAELGLMGTDWEPDAAYRYGVVSYIGYAFSCIDITCILEYPKVYAASSILFMAI